MAETKRRIWHCRFPGNSKQMFNGLNHSIALLSKHFDYCTQYCTVCVLNRRSSIRREGIRRVGIRRCVIRISTVSIFCRTIYILTTVCLERSVHLTIRNVKDKQTENRKAKVELSNQDTPKTYIHAHPA